MQLRAPHTFLSPCAPDCARLRQIAHIADADRAAPCRGSVRRTQISTRVLCRRPSKRKIMTALTVEARNLQLSKAPDSHTPATAAARGARVHGGWRCVARASCVLGHVVCASGLGCAKQVCSKQVSSYGSDGYHHDPHRCAPCASGTACCLPACLRAKLPCCHAANVPRCKCAMLQMCHAANVPDQLHTAVRGFDRRR